MTGENTMTGKIADTIAGWAKGKPKWTPVPANQAVGARLDFTASDSTFRVAKRLLAEQGVLVRHGRDYYVA
jgi:hypothetical protein